jgi:excisionase family DNA binding protein
MVLVTTATVARQLGITPCRVRQLADIGRIPSTRTAEGVRLYRVDDVERVARERAAQRSGGEVEANAGRGGES